MKKIALVISLVGMSVIGVGCSHITSGGPMGSPGCTPVKTIFTTYLGEDAARHSRGIAYASRAGHLDLAHIRKSADWTGAYAKTISSHLRNKRTEFSLRGTEPRGCYVKIKYPNGWDQMDSNTKKEIIHNASAEMGAYFSNIDTIMHETLTWYGWRSTFILPEFLSAYSWEDRFSDAFGCYAGEMALKDKEHGFKQALNIVLENEFKRLGVQPKEVCIKTVSDLEGKWYHRRGFNGADADFFRLYA
jgi:hypothetical protein